jgi:iron(III) transport system substrate-binding protein
MYLKLARQAIKQGEEIMKKHFISIILLVSMLLTALVPTTALESKSDNLKLYSSLPTTQLDLMVSMFNEKYPNIAVDVFSADSNYVFARVQTEAGATGDLVLGGNLESFQTAQELFTEYTTANVKNFHKQYAGTAFTPIQLHISALVVNKDIANKLGVDITSWESLKDEKLSGKVAYMDPTKSSPVTEQTAFVNNFARAIDVANPSAPSFVLNAVTVGQYAAGIVNEEKIIERQLSGANIDVVYATEGVAMGASYAGILADTKNEENAKLFLDFITGKEYQQAAANILHQRSVRIDVDFDLEGIAPTKNLKALDVQSMAILTSLQSATR